MKRILLYLALFIVALGLIAPGASAKWWRQQKTVKVMTRNLYLGADIFPVIQVGLVDPSLVPEAVSRVYHTVPMKSRGKSPMLSACRKCRPITSRPRAIFLLLIKF